MTQQDNTDKSPHLEKESTSTTIDHANDDVAPLQSPSLSLNSRHNDSGQELRAERNLFGANLSNLSQTNGSTNTSLTEQVSSHFNDDKATPVASESQQQGVPTKPFTDGFNKSPSDVSDTSILFGELIKSVARSDNNTTCFSNNQDSSKKSPIQTSSAASLFSAPALSSFGTNQGCLAETKSNKPFVFSPNDNSKLNLNFSGGTFSGFSNDSNQQKSLFSSSNPLNLNNTTKTGAGSLSFGSNTNPGLCPQAPADATSTQRLTTPENPKHRPKFSALNPTNAASPMANSSGNDNPANSPSNLNISNPKESPQPNNTPRLAGVGVGGSALDFLRNIPYGKQPEVSRPAETTLGDSTALGKLSALRDNPTFSSNTSTPTLAQTASVPTTNIDPSQNSPSKQEAVPNGPFIPPNEYFGLTSNKPIIDNSSEFNYKLPDHLAQPNSTYVKNYVVPKLGSVDEITEKLRAAHIENKSQLDTLDSLSSNIIDLVQNKNMYYGSGQFKDMNLKPELIHGLFDMGYRIPSRIQEATLPIIVNQKRNLVAQSQNGTGKTGAFALAVLSNLDPNTNYPEAVILAPTYELASQIKSVIDKMAKYIPGMSTILGIKGNRLTLGTKITDKIVIGTPGTIADWMTKFKFFDTRNIKMFVLDEADVMISQAGHLSMCSRIKSALPKSCQSLLFSATYPASVCSFANFSVPNATVIRVKSSELTLESVKQYYTYVSNQNEQFDFAWNLFTTICIAQCIIFCDTRSAAKNLASKFVSCGFKTSVISGEQPVEERAAVIERLRKGKDKVLIATNVVARGIDISTTSLIINFDIPVEYNHNRHSNNTVPNFETYLHRVGRAGRFGVKGICVTVAKSMQDIDLLGQIQAYFNHEIKPIHPWDAEQLQNLDPIKYAMEE